MNKANIIIQLNFYNDINLILLFENVNGEKNLRFYKNRAEYVVFQKINITLHS